MGLRATSRAGSSRRAGFSLPFVPILLVGIALLTWALGPPLIDALTVNQDIRDTARAYLWWIVAAPVLGVACYQLDGIFIGATQSKDLRNMMLVSVLVFLAAWQYLTDAFGNHGLWAALMLFLVVRALTLLARLPALMRERL